MLRNQSDRRRIPEWAKSILKADKRDIDSGALLRKKSGPRGSAIRVAHQTKCDRRESNDRTALLLKADRNTSDSLPATNLKADNRSRALKNRPEPRDAAVDIPLCRFSPSAGGGA